MKYVLDTHALIWFLENNAKLGAVARAELQLPSSELLIPAIVLAEVCWMIENRKTSIASAEDFFDELDADLRVTILPMDREIVEKTTLLHAIGEMHDRQIVATTQKVIASGHAVFLLTKDQNITNSGLLPVQW